MHAILMDFAQDVLTHRTPVFYIYFVIGWISGTAVEALVVASLAGLILRRCRRRLTVSAGVLSRVVAVTGAFLSFAYLLEIAEAYFSTNAFERFTFFHARADWDYYAWFYWGNLIVGCGLPQLFWFRRCRGNLWITFPVALLVFISRHSERILIYLTSLSQDFLPSSWQAAHPFMGLLRDMPAGVVTLLIITFVTGWGFGSANSALLIASLAGMFARRCRRRLAGSVEVLARVMLAANLLCVFAILLEIAYLHLRPASHGTSGWLSFSGADPDFFSTWGRLVCLAVFPQFFRMRRCRVNVILAFIIALLVLASLEEDRIASLFAAPSSPEFLPGPGRE